MNSNAGHKSVDNHHHHYHHHSISCTGWMVDWWVKGRTGRRGKRITGRAHVMYIDEERIRRGDVSRDARQLVGYPH